MGGVVTLKSVIGVMLVLAGILISVLSAPAMALDWSDKEILIDEGYKPLNGFAIAALIRNRTVTLTYGRNDNTTEIYFDGFGGRLSLAKNRKLTRYWQIRDNTYCETSLIGAGLQCSIVLHKDGEYRLCPLKENICWYSYSNFRNGDVLGLKALEDGLISTSNSGG